LSHYVRVKHFRRAINTQKYAKEIITCQQSISIHVAAFRYLIVYKLTTYIYVYYRFKHGKFILHFNWPSNVRIVFRTNVASFIKSRFFSEKMFYPNTGYKICKKIKIKIANFSAWGEIYRPIAPLG